jgi:hypothetical protein
MATEYEPMHDPITAEDFVDAMADVEVEDKGDALFLEAQAAGLEPGTDEFDRYLRDRMTWDEFVSYSLALEARNMKAEDRVLPASV